LAFGGFNFEGQLMQNREGSERMPALNVESARTLYSFDDTCIRSLPLAVLYQVASQIESAFRNPKFAIELWN